MKFLLPTITRCSSTALAIADEQPASGLLLNLDTTKEQGHS
jgi:hypothetical protein